MQVLTASAEMKAPLTYLMVFEVLLSHPQESLPQGQKPQGHGYVGRITPRQRQGVMETMHFLLEIFEHMLGKTDPPVNGPNVVSVAN